MCYITGRYNDELEIEDAVHTAILTLKVYAGVHVLISMTFICTDVHVLVSMVFIIVCFRSNYKFKIIQ